MRILLAGDTHANTEHVKYLIKTAQEQDCDRIFQVGDFGYFESEKWGLEYLELINDAAERANVVIYFLRGNHDNIKLLLENYQDDADHEGFLMVRSNILFAPDGHCWEWGGKRFIVFGGAYSVDKDYRLAQERYDSEHLGVDCSGTHWFPDEEMTAEAFRNAIVAAPNTVDFMLTHDKPRMSNPGWNRKDLEECWPNQNRIQEAVDALKPHLLVHGHLHYRYDDQIMGPHGKTQVLGLNSEPWGSGRFYSGPDTWYVLDTDA